MSPNKFDVNKHYYPKAPRLPALLRALCFFLFYYVTRMVVYNGAAIFFVSRYGDDIEAANEMYLKSSNMLSVISGVIILALLALFFSARRKKLSKEFYLNKVRFSTAAVCFFAGISLNFATTLVMSYLPQSLLESYGEASSSVMDGHTVWYILAAIIMAPILEEVIFRAMKLTNISTATGNVLAVLLSSAVFGAVHGHIVWSTYAFVIGCLLGTVFIRTRSVIASILTHLAFNSVSLLSYVNVDAMPQNAQALYYTFLSLCESLSVPLSITLIIILFHETADVSSKMPVGFDEE